MTDESVQQADGEWADQVAEGEDYDETVGEAQEDAAPVGVDDTGSIDEQDVPDGYEERDEEVAEDDPADVPDEQAAAQRALDGQDGLDAVLPEGTDSIVDDGDDWE